MNGWNSLWDREIDRIAVGVTDCVAVVQVLSPACHWLACLCHSACRCCSGGASKQASARKFASWLCANTSAASVQPLASLFSSGHVASMDKSNQPTVTATAMLTLKSYRCVTGNASFYTLVAAPDSECWHTLRLHRSSQGRATSARSSRCLLAGKSQASFCLQLHTHLRVDNARKRGLSGRGVAAVRIPQGMMLRLRRSEYSRALFNILRRRTCLQALQTACSKSIPTARSQQCCSVIRCKECGLCEPENKKSRQPVAQLCVLARHSRGCHDHLRLQPLNRSFNAGEGNCRALDGDRNAASGANGTGAGQAFGLRSRRLTRERERESTECTVSTPVAGERGRV